MRKLTFSETYDNILNTFAFICIQIMQRRAGRDENVPKFDTVFA